jgi:hypothetical protein
MEKYRAKRDCYYNDFFLKKGEILTVAKGTVVDFNLLEKITEPKAKEVATKTETVDTKNKTK